MVIIVKNQLDLNCKVLEYSVGVCKMLYRSVKQKSFSQLHAKSLDRLRYFEYLG